MRDLLDRLDERVAIEIMGWVRSRPDGYCWMKPGTGPGERPRFRVTRANWHPTTLPFCLDMLLRELEGNGLVAQVVPAMEAGRMGWRCVIPHGDDARAPASAWAPTRNLAVVTAALEVAPGLVAVGDEKRPPDLGQAGIS